MAEDLKAATPDTTFAWATAGLFGADSQAAASPSYFPAADIRAALLALANTWSDQQTLTGKYRQAVAVDSADAWVVISSGGSPIAQINTIGRFFTAGGDAFAVGVGSGNTTLYNAGGLGWTSGASASAALDTGFFRIAAAITGVRGASLSAGGALSFLEQTAPAGAANEARLYAEDNGSGKTKLMVIMPTGAAIQLAIEP